MKDYIIMADSNCDLPQEKSSRLGIEIIPGHIQMPDGREYPALSDWSAYTREEFYTALKADPNSVKTSPPSVGEYEERFERAAAAGKDVICVTISGGISGSIGFARIAAKDIENKYPDITVKCIDSMRFGPGFGLLVTDLAKLKAEGKTCEEVAACAEENKNRYHQCGWLDDLSFVAAKGRMTHAKAFFGTLAGIKPLGEFDYNGLTTVIGKVRGAKTAYRILIKYMKATIENPESQTIVIAHTERQEAAEKYRDLILQELKPAGVEIYEVFSSCAANIGPGLMAAYYTGTPISQGLEKEKQLIDSFLNDETI